jgi:methionyl aminopeptidase
MIITTQEERAILRECGKRLAYVRDALVEKIVVGSRTDELDAYAYKLCVRDGDRPAFLNYEPPGSTRPFPASICISINDIVVHGIPTEHPQIIKDGDLVSVDLGLSHRGIITDTAITIAVGTVTPRERNLIRATEIALSRAIEKLAVGARIGDISRAIEHVAREQGFGVPKELGGHGVGRRVHEKPNIPNVFTGQKGGIFSDGEVVAIEPIFTIGSDEIIFEDDGYTVRTKDGSKSAHVEHTVLITADGAEIVT